MVKSLLIYHHHFMRRNHLDSEWNKNVSNPTVMWGLYFKSLVKYKIGADSDSHEHFGPVPPDGSGPCQHFVKYFQSSFKINFGFNFQVKIHFRQKKITFPSYPGQRSWPCCSSEAGLAFQTVFTNFFIFGQGTCFLLLIRLFMLCTY